MRLRCHFCKTRFSLTEKLFKERKRQNKSGRYYCSTVCKREELRQGSKKYKEKLLEDRLKLISELAEKRDCNKFMEIDESDTHV